MTPSWPWAPFTYLAPSTCFCVCCRPSEARTKTLYFLCGGGAPVVQDPNCCVCPSCCPDATYCCSACSCYFACPCCGPCSCQCCGGVSLEWVKLGQSLFGAKTNDSFGRAVSLSQDEKRCAVDASYADNGELINAGAVTIYQITGSEKTPIGLPIIGGGKYSKIGWSVSLSADGSICAVGSPFDGAAGCVRVYSLQAGAWVQLGNTMEGAAQGQNFGFSVSLSSDGQRCCVGASGDGSDLAYPGQASVFEFRGGNWEPVGSALVGASGGDQFGFSVSLRKDGRACCIGAPQSSKEFKYAGACSVYEEVNGEFGLVVSWTGQAANDKFGWSAALNDSGTICAVGAPESSAVAPRAGEVRVFKRNLFGKWKSLGKPLHGDPDPDSKFGRAVTLNRDGDRVAVSAPYEDLAGGATNAGTARAFQLCGDEWGPLGSPLLDSTNGLYFGYALSMSGSGNRMVVGAPGDGTVADFAGEAIFYDLSLVW